ncbi:hypothetical protein F0236_23100, partial [Vibrio splendidus]|uniref:hypothetical protein n=1 Tax=Vibrio splendidus TaxID=29497 RepID=UPI00148C495F
MTVASTRNNSVGFSFFLYLSLFLLVFDLSIPPIKSIGSAPLSIIISLLSLVMFNKGKSKEVLVDSFNIIGIYFLILVYVVIRLLASDTEEPSFLMSSLKSSVILIATLLFIYVFQSELTIKNVINIFFFNALFCLIAGVVPPLLDLAVLVKHGYHEVGFITYRSAFLSGSSAFGIAAPYTIFI